MIFALYPFISAGSGASGEQNNLFDELMFTRRNEANRTFLVQLQSERATHAAIDFCSMFGMISNGFFYRNKFQANFLLLEFQTDIAANAVLREIAKSQQNQNALKSLSHFLVFSPTKKLVINRQQKNIYVQRSTNESENLATIFRRQGSLNEHVYQLYNRTRLNELAIRLRFMAAMQIEAVVSSMFPSAKALPFGSSMNGCGRMGSDLDLVLSFDEKNVENEMPLKFNSKGNELQRHHHLVILQTLSKLMENWIPGVADMQPILHAKVPIIKYKQSFLDLDVDLSSHNLYVNVSYMASEFRCVMCLRYYPFLFIHFCRSGLYMSELLFLFGEIDERVRPLMFFVRRWAEDWKVTRVIRPGPCISNFVLSCLVIFYLQQLKQPILPSINELKQQATNTDIRPITADIDCIFLRDINRLRFKTTNTDTLEQLIENFYDFYANLATEQLTISLNAGHTIPKSTLWPLHIVNPLEPELNVGACVSEQETFDFRYKAKLANASFRELRRGFSPNNSKKLLEFFNPKEINDVRTHIVSKMNANIRKTLFPKKNNSRTKTGLSVRSLTKLT